MDDKKFADKIINWAEVAGAKSIQQGGKKIGGTYEEQVQDVLADDTGMNAYEFQSPNMALPLVIEFGENSGSQQELAFALKRIFDNSGIKTEAEPVPVDGSPDRLRIASYSFVEPNKFVKGGTVVNIHNMPEVL